MRHRPCPSSPQFRRITTRESMRRGDDDVNLRCLFAEQRQLLLAKLRARTACRIAASDSHRPARVASSKSRKTETPLPSIRSVRRLRDARRTRARDRTECNWACPDGGESRNPGPHDENLGGLYLAGRSDLACEEATELVARLDDGTIAGDVRHRRQGIHLLGTAEMRGTMSMARVVNFLSLSAFRSSSFCAGQTKEMSVLPSGAALISSSVGSRSFAMTSASLHRSAAVGTTVTPAAR